MTFISVDDLTLKFGMTCNTVSWFDIDTLEHQEGDVEDDMQDKLTANSVR